MQPDFELLFNSCKMLLLDPCAALKRYLVAASLATNFFADMVSVVDIIDQSSLVRLVRIMRTLSA